MYEGLRPDTMDELFVLGAREDTGGWGHIVITGTPDPELTKEQNDRKHGE